MKRNNVLKKLNKIAGIVCICAIILATFDAKSFAAWDHNRTISHTKNYFTRPSTSQTQIIPPLEQPVTAIPAVEKSDVNDPTAQTAATTGASVEAIPNQPNPSQEDPISADTHIINNGFWGIYQDDSLKASDNSVNITKALEWAGNNGFQNVKLQTGTYYINGVHNNGPLAPDNGIFVPSNMDFDLNNSTLIQPPNASIAYSMINVMKEANVTVSNGTIMGDRLTHDYVAVASSHEFGFGVDIRGSSNVQIVNLKISQMTGDAILISGVDFYLSANGSICKNVAIQNCDLSYCRRQGISITGADNVDIGYNRINNIMGTAPESGIDMEAELDWPVINVYIHGNDFSNLASSAVIFHKSSESCVLENNTVDGFIDVVYGKANIIRNNQITNGGVRLTYTQEVYDTKIEGNILTNSYIKSLINVGTLVLNNTLTDGYINFSYCTGAVVGNTLVNKKTMLDAGILIYADKQCGNGIYNTYLLDNNVSGNYLNSTIISNYQNLAVSTDALRCNAYLAKTAT